MYEFSYYVGTFGDYDLGAIRHALAASESPAPVELPARR